MSIFSRFVACVFGAALIAAFFMPWIEIDFGLAKKSVTGYEIVKGVGNIQSKMQKLENLKEKFKEKVLRMKPEPDLLSMPKIYWLLLFPLTGGVAIFFSGFIRVPLLTFLTSGGTIAYACYNYFGGSEHEGKIHQWFESRIGLDMGLYLTLFCIVVILLNSLIQLFSRSKKAAQ